MATTLAAEKADPGSTMAITAPTVPPPMPIGTSSTPVASMVSNTLWAPCQAYSIDGSSSASAT